MPFASTFAAFLSRAYDFIRMAAISQADIRLCGSHAGVSIGEDGPSQMALEDLAMIRAVHGSTVLYPSDANQTAKLVAEMADRDGIVYMRTTRAATPVVYGADEEFPVGGSRVLRDGDDLAIVAAGITLHESLKAAEQLAGEGIEARVIDLYSVKPVDAETLRAAAEATGGRILTVEDHWPEGGIGDAVLEALSDGETPAARGAARRARDAGLRQAGRAAGRGRDRRRAHRRGGALARRRRRRLALEERSVELALPLAGSRVDLGPLDGLAHRSRRAAPARARRRAVRARGRRRHAPSLPRPPRP